MSEAQVGTLRITGAFYREMHSRGPSTSTDYWQAVTKALDAIANEIVAIKVEPQ